MPKQPFTINQHIKNMSKGVYTKFAKDLAQMKGRIYPLHVGDTFLEPVQQSTVEGIQKSSYQAKYNYFFQS